MPSNPAKATSRLNYRVGFLIAVGVAVSNRLLAPATLTLLLASGIALFPALMYWKHPAERFSTVAWIGVFFHCCLGVVLLLPSTPPEVNSPLLVPIVAVGVLAWIALLAWMYTTSRARAPSAEPTT